MELPNDLTTEAVDPTSADLDRASTERIVQLMNEGDAGVVRAVAAQTEKIAAAIDAIASRLAKGGRLFYVGAGTSGRLGVLDAAECPPTFNTDPELVQAVIAGGDTAILSAVEGAEDSSAQGAKDLEARAVSATDAVVGIAASGFTPYVIGAVKHAADRGACTVAISCNEGAPLAQAVGIPITIVVGPEILAGSTRLKAGTATKMVLNMISTGVMVRRGKTYGNLMVDLKAANQKLRLRTKRLLCRITGVDVADAEALLARCGGELKTSVVAHRHGVAADAARSQLRRFDGHLRAALESPLEI